MEKRTIIALALSFVVLGFYPVVLHKMYPDYYAAKEKNEKTAAVPAAKVPVGASAPAASSASALPASAKPILGESVKLATSSLEAQFSKTGGVISRLSFFDFHGPEDKNGPLTLFTAADATTAPLYLDLRDPAGASADDYEIARTADSAIMTSSTAGLKITKEIRFRKESYGEDLKVSFQNTTAAPVRVKYRLVAGSSFPLRNSIDRQYSEANFYSIDKDKPVLKHIKESKKDKTVESAGPLQWLAMKDRHFSIILKPADAGFTGVTTGLGDHTLKAALVSPEFVLAPGQTLSHTFTMYAGPNDYRHLEALGLEALVNFGKLDAIGKLLVGALEMVYKFTKNYGVAIILLTMFLNLLLFPLTRTSYLSMKRMQLIQPQMNKVKEQHKKNPEKMNKEMMELYKKHKVNPFGGCLPMVIQMPVFMALYVALSKYVGLVNAKFLWVRDLSSPDNVYLPFTLPFIGNSIHLLPLIMVAGMFFQQRLTQIKTGGQDPATETQQRMMAVMMPIMFGFIFYAMPAGLVLYWLTNTVIMTSYQLRLKNLTLEG